MSLSQKVMLGMTLSFLTILLVSGWCFSSTLFKSITKQYESKGLAIATGVADTAIEAILDNDPASLQAMIDALLSIEGVSYIVIQDQNKEIICHTFYPGIPEKIAAVLPTDQKSLSFKFHHDGKEYWNFNAPILSGEIGYLSVGMDLTPIKKQAMTTILQEMALILIICVLTLCGMLLLIRRIIRPMRALTGYAKDLAAHDFLKRLPNGDNIQKMKGYQQQEVQALTDGFIKLETALMNNLKELENSLKVQERLQSELSIAADIQNSLLPSETYVVYESVVATHYIHPARDIGGDFVDHFLLHHRYLVSMVGDVSGKGVSAALIMATIMTMIRSTAQTVNSPGEILTVVNQEFCKRNVNELFISVFLSVLDMHTGELQFANAGHNHPYRNNAGREWTPFGQDIDLVLGIDEACFYREQSITLKPNESIFLYTDGITEAMNTADELYGEPRLLAKLNENTGVATIVEDVSTAVKQFSGTAPQSDDQTILHLQFTGMPSILNTAELSFYFENTMDSISKLALVIEQFGQGNELSTETVMNLNLVLEELISNTIYYGYSDHDLHHIYVTLQYKGDIITAVVTDDGNPFNPLEAPEVDPDTLLEERTIGGLGILFVKSLTQDLQYERTENINRLTIVMEAKTNHGT